ncbi:PorV/PorQ family protein [candidate division KSB1 bacterium]|nr:PorV/PorQ family protein [candidate division KSB1 bacterium]
MRELSLKTVWFFLPVLFFSANALAQREQVFVGARPLGLGETFVAIANDGNAIYWNPAGLPFLQREEFSSMYANLYGLGIKNGYISYTRPLFNRLALGLDWLRFGFDDDELTFVRNQFALSGGFAVNNNFSIGANVKYLNTDAKLYGNSEGEAWGFGIDLGALYRHPFDDLKFLQELRAGVMLHDATGTRIEYDTGTREEILPPNLRLGLAYMPFETLRWKWLSLHEPLLAIDLDDRLHLGSEVWLFDDFSLALRGGVQKDLHTEEGLSWSAGFSIKKDVLRIDYAYTMPPTLPASHRFSLSFSYNFNPHLVEINKIDMAPVFSALSRHYNKPHATVGRVLLRNRHNAPIAAKISFAINGYTKGTRTFPVRVDTGSVTPVELAADFSDNLLKEGDTEKSLRGEVTVSYKYRGKLYDEKAPARFFLHGGGAIRWDQPGRAAAFVTQNDSLVRAFAVATSVRYEGQYANWILKSEIADAIALYEALCAHGVRPTPDPDATFSAATDSGFYIDTITWPDALLSNPRDRRAGDCEDLAILYASVLASQGIETALLKIPGHIFMMLNTGIPVAHRYMLPLPETLLVQAKEMLWLPVETTKIESPFLAAWQQGASEYRRASAAGNLQEIFVRDEQKIYPPVDHTPVKRAWWPMPDSTATHRAIEAGLLGIDAMKDRFMETNLLAVLRNYPDSLSVRNQLGCVYAGLSDFERAQKEFETALQLDSAYAAALNNLGNVYFIRGKLPEAQRYYEGSLSSREFKLGTYLNLAILYQMMAEEKKDTLEAQSLLNRSLEVLQNAVRLLQGDSTRVLAFLGPAGVETGTMADPMTNKKSKTWRQRFAEVKRFVNKAFESLVKKQPRLPKKPNLKSAGPTGSEADEDRRFILYWDFE